MENKETFKKIMAAFIILCLSTTGLVLLFLNIFKIRSSGESVLAFPEAEGDGAGAIGGRGGKIIEVTNLNDTGPGSLRAACEEKGPRIVIFRVAGIITIKNPIEITSPFITIAGQTAPAGGITIKGHQISVRTHDAIIRFIRVRTGRRDDFHMQEGDCLSIGNHCQNVIIDHCSFSWSNDENMEIWSDEDAAQNVTVSWNLIAEGLSYKHESCGLLIGSDINALGMKNLCIHHNLFMHGDSRFPLAKSHDAEIINNLMYNWRWWPAGIEGGIIVDIINNKFKPGANMLKSYDYEVMVRIDWKNQAYGPPGKPSIYIEGNIGPHQSNPKGDNWGMLICWREWTPLGYQPDRIICERKHPMQNEKYPVTIHHVDILEKIILPDVGAAKRLDENGHWISDRDLVDERLVREYVNGTGFIPFDENDVGGYPKINAGKPYNDSDHDGMPDQWEKRWKFDPDDPLDSSKDKDGDGYTNIEEFLNGTNPGKGI